MKRDPMPPLMSDALAQANAQATANASANANGTSRWRAALIALAVALAWIIVAFYGTAAAMVGIWARSETFAHGFIVAPISLWLIWRMRERLRVLEPRPSWIAIPAIAAAGFVWLLGDVGAVNAVSQFAFVALLALAVPAILGIQVTRAMFFPLGFLFFSVPFGEFLLPTLMAHTADFTIAAVRASGVPVYREGLQFVVPNGRWSIVEACSGVRYLIASLVVGTLFAYLNYATMWRRVAFIGVSIAVPIVANWLRAYMIVMLGYLSDNKIATGVDHIIYGWLFFGLVMLVMFGIGMRWQEPAAAAPARARGVAPAAADRGASSAGPWAAALGVVAVTALWPIGNWAIQRSAPNPVATLATIEVPGWQASTAPDGSFTPHFLAPSAVLHESLRRGDEAVGLYVAYYRGQNFDHKLVSSENVLLRADDRMFHVVAAGTQALAIGTATLPVVAARIRGADGRLLEARQWYWIDGRLTASDAVAKAGVAWSRITGRGDDSAVIVIYTPAGDGTHPDETLQAFLRSGWPAIAVTLANARERGR